MKTKSVTYLNISNEMTIEMTVLQNLIYNNFT